MLIEQGVVFLETKRTWNDIINKLYPTPHHDLISTLMSNLIKSSNKII